MTDIVERVGQMDSDFTQMGIDPAQYEVLERDFNEVLKDLA